MYALNNPLRFIDHTSYLTAEEFDDIVRNLMNSPDGGAWNPFDGISYYGGYGASISAGQSYLGTFGGGSSGYLSTKYSIRFATEICNRNGLIRNLR